MIIVGAGVAGLAALEAALGPIGRLGPAPDGGIDEIVLLEAGTAPLGPPPTVGLHPALDRGLAERLRTSADRPWVGVGVGGSGSVNGSVLHRPRHLDVAGDVPPAEIEPWFDRWWSGMAS